MLYDDRCVKIKEKKIVKRDRRINNIQRCVHVCDDDDDDDDGITKSIYLWMSFIHLYFM